MKVLKKTNRGEYRIYLEGEEVEGQIIFKGHKLAVGNLLLNEIIDYKIDRFTNTIFFINYENGEKWETTKENNKDINILFSWDSLLNNLKKERGNFRKIIITKN